MKKVFLPPFLPLLGVLLFLVGLALRESSLHLEEVVSEVDYEPLRWVMFVPFLLPFLYGYFLMVNVADTLIANMLPVKWVACSMILAGGAMGGSYIALFRIPEATPRIVIFCTSILATAAMSFWKKKMAGAPKSAPTADC